MADMSEDPEKARNLRERAARRENAGNLAALLILMADELEERASSVKAGAK